MADLNTTGLALVKPEVGASANSWGGKLNLNWDKLDGRLATVLTLNVSAGNVDILLEQQQTIGVFKISGPLQADVTIRFQPRGGLWGLVNQTTGNFNLFAKTTTGGGLLRISRLQATTVVCDGAELYSSSDTVRPAFSAFMTANQAVAAGAATILNFTSELFDVGNFYTTGSGSWLPPPGIVNLNLAWTQPDAGVVGANLTAIYKNGGPYRWVSGNSPQGGQVSLIDFANGTDFYQAGIVMPLAATIQANANATFFQGNHLG